MDIAAAAVVASGAYVLASATKTAMETPIEVTVPVFTDVTNPLHVQGDYFARTRRSTSNAAWNSLPIPTSQDPGYWNSITAEQPIEGRGVQGMTLPKPNTHAPSVYALTRQQPTAMQPNWY